MAAKESGNGGNWRLNLGDSSGPLAASLVLQDVEKDGSSTVADTRTTQLGASCDSGVVKLARPDRLRAEPRAARVTLAHGAMTFIDFFVLLKTADGWKIANKAFHGQPS